MKLATHFIPTLSAALLLLTPIAGLSAQENADSDTPASGTENATPAPPAQAIAIAEDSTMTDISNDEANDSPMTNSDFMGNAEYLLHFDLSTGGRVVVQLYPDVAPAHVERIKLLVRQGFYDRIKFHRVIDGFMAQTGDPTATGTGGSSLPNLKAEFNSRPHLRGTLSMARAEEEDSANSQFFIMLQPRFSLDNRYTVFGRVISGMEYVDAINRGEPPTIMSEIVQLSVAADNKPMPPMSQLIKGEDDSSPALKN